MLPTIDSRKYRILTPEMPMNDRDTAEAAPEVGMLPFEVHGCD
jgi:hypothetical protein